jgi:hypothetical protein
VRQAGVEQTQFEAGLKQLAGQMQQAAGDNRAYIETQGGFRISIRDANGVLLSQEAMLYKVADAVAAAKTDQDKLAIASAAFGVEVGARMVPALAGGSQALRQLGDRAAALGIVIDEQAVTAGGRLVDRLAEMKARTTGLRNSIAEALIPATEKLLGWVEDLADEYGPLVKKFLESEEGAKTLTTAVVALTLALGVAGLVAAAALAASALAALFTPVGIVTVAIGSTLAVMVAQFILLGLVIQDLYTYFTGGKSALGEFWGQFRESEGILGSIVRLFEAMVGLGRVLYTALAPVGELLAAMGGAVIQGQLETMLALLNALGWVADNVLVPKFNEWAATVDKLSAGINSIASFGGGLLGVGAGTDTAAAAAGSSAGASIRSATNSLSQQITVNVTGGADGQSIADQIRAALEAQTRQAAAVFAGSEV